MNEFGVVVYDYVDIDYALLQFKGVFRSINGQHLLSWRDVTMKFEMVGTPLEVAQSVKKLDVSGHGVCVSADVETPFIIFGMFFPDGNCGYMRIYTSTTTITSDGSCLEVPPKHVAPAKPDDVDSENTYHFNFQQSRGTAQALKLCVFSEQQLGTLRITHSSCPRYQKRIAEARSPVPGSPELSFRPFATPVSPHRGKSAHVNSGMGYHVSTSMHSAHSPIKPCRLDNAFLSSYTTSGIIQVQKSGKPLSGKVTPDVRPRSVVSSKRSPLFNFLRPKSARSDYKDVEIDNDAITPLLGAMTGPEDPEDDEDDLVDGAIGDNAVDDGITPAMGLARMYHNRSPVEAVEVEVERGRSHSYAQYGASIGDIAFTHGSEAVDDIGTGTGTNVGVSACGMGTGMVRRTSFAQYAISIEDTDHTRDKYTSVHPYQLSLDGLSVADTKSHVSKENYDRDVSPLFRGLTIPRTHTGKSPGMFGRTLDIPEKNIPIAKSMPLTAKTSPASPVKFTLSGNNTHISGNCIRNTGNSKENPNIARASSILTITPSTTPLYKPHTDRINGTGVGKSGSIGGNEAGFSHTSTSTNTGGMGMRTISQLLRQAASLQVDIDEDIMFRDDIETHRGDVEANVPPDVPQCSGGNTKSTSVMNIRVSSPMKTEKSSENPLDTQFPEFARENEQEYRQYPLPPSPLKFHATTPTRHSLASNVSKASIFPIDTRTAVKATSLVNPATSVNISCTSTTDTHPHSRSSSMPLSHTNVTVDRPITPAKPLPLLNIATTPEFRTLPPQITSPRFRHVTKDNQDLNLPNSVLDIKYEESYPHQVFETPTPEAKDKTEVPAPTEVDKQHQMSFVTAMKSAAVVGEPTQYLSNDNSGEDKTAVITTHQDMSSTIVSARSVDMAPPTASSNSTQTHTGIISEDGGINADRNSNVVKDDGVGVNRGRKTMGFNDTGNDENNEISEGNSWEIVKTSANMNYRGVSSGRIPLQTQGSSRLNSQHVVTIGKNQETPTKSVSQPRPATEFLPLPSQTTPDHHRTTPKRHLSPSCAALIQKKGFPVHIPVLRPQPTLYERFLSAAYAPVDSTLLLKDYTGVTSVRIATTEEKIKASVATITNAATATSAASSTTVKSVAGTTHAATPGTGITGATANNISVTMSAATAVTHATASLTTATATVASENGTNVVPSSIVQKLHQIGLSSMAGTQCPMDLLSRATSYVPAADLRNRYPYQQNIGNVHTFPNMNNDKNPKIIQNDKNIPKNNQNDENDDDENYNKYQHNGKYKGYVPPTLNMNVDTNKGISTSTSTSNGMGIHDKNVEPSVITTKVGIRATTGISSDPVTGPGIGIDIDTTTNTNSGTYVPIARKTTHTNHTYIPDENGDVPVMDLTHFIDAPAKRVPFKPTLTNYTYENYEKTPQKSLKTNKNSDNMENVQLLTDINTFLDQNIKKNDYIPKSREDNLHSPLPVPLPSQLSTGCDKPVKKRGFFSWFTSHKKNTNTQY